MIPIQDMFFKIFINEENLLKIKNDIGGLCQDENLVILQGLYKKGNLKDEWTEYVRMGNDFTYFSGKNENLKTYDLKGIFKEKTLSEFKKILNSWINEDEQKLEKSIYMKYFFKDENYKIDLKKCKNKELNTYIFKKYLEKIEKFDREILFKFIDFTKEKQDLVLKELVRKKKQELKTDVKQEVIIPVGKQLTVEEMGLLEATIFGTFIIVKSLFFKS